MPVLKDRQPARASLQKVFSSLPDKIIPPDAATPLPGGRKFVNQILSTLFPVQSCANRLR